MSETLDTLLDRLKQRTIWLARTGHTAGRNRLGGLPNLSADQDWPRHLVHGNPLHFLAQLDLAELPKTPLMSGGPVLSTRGVLMFFADIEDTMVWSDYGPRDCARVIYTQSPGTDREAPADLPRVQHAEGHIGGSFAYELSVFPLRPLDAHVIDTFTGVEAFFQGAASREADLRTLSSIERALGTSVPRVKPWHKDTWHLTTHEHSAAIDDKSQPCIIRHQMFGAATHVQGAAQQANEDDAICLLQLDTDWGVHQGFQFCDMGMVQFWMRPGHLAQSRFDLAWATTEGG